MPGKSFQTVVSIPTKICIDKQCSSVTMSTARGYIGILPNHLPIVGAIRPGYITLHYTDGSSQVGLVNYGVYYFNNNQLHILSDFFEFSCHGVDTNALEEIKRKIEEASKRASLSEQTANALNSYMKAVTFTARKNSGNKN